MSAKREPEKHEQEPGSKRQKHLTCPDELASLIPDGWSTLSSCTQQPWWDELVAFLRYQMFYPSKSNIFKALELTPLDNVRVVILGQDPYHGSGQASGLAFHVNTCVKQPPSLRNICKKVNQECGEGRVDLEDWAKRGVLLLNTVLTVAPAEANSHRDKGWEHFTDHVIQLVNNKDEPVVFMLWGKNAQKKQNMVDQERHLVITAPHPSPLSAHRGFFDEPMFTRANEFLQQPIDWISEPIPDIDV